MNLGQFMRMAGEEFIVIRDGIEIITIEGLPNHETATKRAYVGFYPGSDIQSGDWIHGKVSNNRFYIEDVKTDIVHGKAFQLKGFYLTKKEFEDRQKKDDSSLTFNIGSVHGSILGNQQNAQITNTYNFEALRQEIEKKGGKDTEVLISLVNDLEKEIKENSHLKKGFLAKHSEIINKHAWITSPLAQIALNWFTGS